LCTYACDPAHAHGSISVPHSDPVKQNLHVPSHVLFADATLGDVSPVVVSAVPLAVPLVVPLAALASSLALALLDSRPIAARPLGDI